MTVPGDGTRCLRPPRCAAFAPNDDEARDARLVIQQSPEVIGTRPNRVTDNGSQFVAREFKDPVRHFAAEPIGIQTYHPEWSGLMDHCHRPARGTLAGAELGTLSGAEKRSGAR